RDRLGGLLPCLPRGDRVRARRDQPAGVSGLLAGLLEPDFGVRAEPHVTPDAPHLVAQEPGLLPALADHKHQAVAIYVTSLFRMLDPKLRQFAHLYYPQD